MKVKKYLIMILLVFVLIGAVSANEDNGSISDNNIVTDDVLCASSDDVQNVNVADSNVGNVSDNMLLASSNESDILGYPAYPEDSFHALQDLIDASGDSLTLDKDYKYYDRYPREYDELSDSPYAEGINIKKKV